MSNKKIKELKFVRKPPKPVDWSKVKNLKYVITFKQPGGRYE